MIDDPKPPDARGDSPLDTGIAGPHVHLRSPATDADSAAEHDGISLHLLMATAARDGDNAALHELHAIAKGETRKTKP